MVLNKIFKGWVLLLIATFSVVNYALAAPKNKTEKLSSKNNAFLFEIGGKKYFYDDVNAAYQRNYLHKNKQLKDLPADSAKSFIDLYSAYRLKIAEAESGGLEKDTNVMKELEQNRKIVAESYLTDKELVNPNLDKMMERRKKEIQIGYMVFPANEANPEDTLAAYAKAMEALKALRSGSDFGETAKKYSADSVSASNGGFINTYITAGGMDRSIENALYSIKPGEYYNDLVKLPGYGYLIVKLFTMEDRKFVNFKHILINFHTDSLGVDLAKNRIDSLYATIKLNNNFEQAASTFSDDNISAVDGGRFREWYSRSTGFEHIGKKLDSDFEKHLFSLKDGELSKPIKTQFGYHLIQRDSTRDLNYNEEKQELNTMYRRAYLETDKRELLESLKMKYGFKLNQPVFDKLISSLDTNKTNLDSLWDTKISPELMTKELYSYRNDKVSIKDLIKLMKTPGKFRGLPTNKEGITKAIQLNTDDKVYTDLINDLSKTNKEYQELVQNFRDGSLLFRVESEEVWNKLKFDTTYAAKYFEQNKEKYFTTLTYDLQELFIINKEEVDDLYSKIKSNKLTFDEAVTKFTQRKGYRESNGILNGMKVGKFKIADLAKEHNLKEGEISEPIEIDKGYSIIKVNKIYPPRQMTFKEAIPEIAPIIQNNMQKEITDKWINSLKKKHNYKINTTEINKLFIK